MGGAPKTSHADTVVILAKCIQFQSYSGSLPDAWYRHIPEVQRAFGILKEEAILSLWPRQLPGQGCHRKADWQWRNKHNRSPEWSEASGSSSWALEHTTRGGRSGRQAAVRIFSKLLVFLRIMIIKWFFKKQVRQKAELFWVSFYIICNKGVWVDVGFKNQGQLLKRKSITTFPQLFSVSLKGERVLITAFWKESLVMPS